MAPLTTYTPFDQLFVNPGMFRRHVLVIKNFFTLLSRKKAIKVKLWASLLVGAFRRKTQTIVVTFFKTNELTDFIKSYK